MLDGLAQSKSFGVSCVNLLEHPEDLESAHNESARERNKSWSWRTSRMARTTSIQELSMDGTNIELLCKFMRVFDIDGNGTLDIDEFLQGAHLYNLSEAEARTWFAELDESETGCVVCAWIVSR